MRERLPWRILELQDTQVKYLRWFGALGLFFQHDGGLCDSREMKRLPPVVITDCTCLNGSRLP